jgi:hypothetical protein
MREFKKPFGTLSGTIQQVNLTLIKRDETGDLWEENNYLFVDRQYSEILAIIEAPPEEFEREY